MRRSQSVSRAEAALPVIAIAATEGSRTISFVRKRREEAAESLPSRGT